VTANCVLPGAVRTGITAPAFAAMPQFEAMWRGKAAVRRIAEPDEIAGLVDLPVHGRRVLHLRPRHLRRWRSDGPPVTLPMLGPRRRAA
jgi:NAD(P)-dependent dehydrogenase (short-subunit alcohol dehydrogenase family)